MKIYNLSSNIICFKYASIKLIILAIKLKCESLYKWNSLL